MPTRRRFLGLTGAAILTLSNGCYPAEAQLASGGDGWAADWLTDKAKVKDLRDHLLGYPINMNLPPREFFDWRRQLLEIGVDEFAFNNVGNPFRESPIPYNTHELEREIIRRVGRLFGFPASDTWGFLSHSGTDSNMHGMYMGRTILTGRTGKMPNVYFTLEAHYSVQILRDLLGLDTVIVATRPDGGMDPEDLERKVSQNADRPALVVATVGTTFKGAVDSVQEIRQRLDQHASYVHLDAALFGGYLPFTPFANQVAFHDDESGALGRYDSIAVSCHKFFGFPTPAGLYVTRSEIYDEFNDRFRRIHNPEYIHHVPGTITCSRDAVKPAEFFYFTTSQAIERQGRDASLMLEHTSYLFDQMTKHFSHLRAVRSNPMSNTVYFRNPGKEIVDKYSLATMHLNVDGASHDYAHVVVMPHVSREVIAEFLNDLPGS